MSNLLVDALLSSILATNVSNGYGFINSHTATKSSNLCTADCNIDVYKENDGFRYDCNVDVKLNFMTSHDDYLIYVVPVCDGESPVFNIVKENNVDKWNTIDTLSYHYKQSEQVIPGGSENVKIDSDYNEIMEKQLAVNSRYPYSIYRGIPRSGSRIISHIGRRTKYRMTNTSNVKLNTKLSFNTKLNSLLNVNICIVRFPKNFEIDIKSISISYNLDNTVSFGVDASISKDPKIELSMISHVNDVKYN